MGFGVRKQLSKFLSVGLELQYTKTFTDYIDDVSKSYVDPALLLANRGQQAVNLAYRGGGTYPDIDSRRGNPNNRDAFYFVQLTVTLRPFVDWYARTSGISSFKKNKKVGCPSTRLQ